MKLKEPWYGYNLGFWSEEDEEQADLDRDDQWARDQCVRILVEDVGAGEDECVADEMKDQVHDQREPRQAEQQLRTDRRGKRATKGGHQRTPAIR